MTFRFFALPALGLTLLLFASPASAVSLNVLQLNESESSYYLILLPRSDGGGDATYSSCNNGTCGSSWDLSVTLSEQPNAGDGPFVYSGSITHGDGQTLSFSGIQDFSAGNGGTADALPHGSELDTFGHGFGIAGGQTFWLITASHAVPEPGLALLVATGLAGLSGSASKRRKR